MKIRVEIKNDILGDDIFWEGDAEHINQIRNIVAENLAQQVRRDGASRKYGMWIVTEVKE